jgi:predicted nucleotidyltransferase
MPSERKVAAMVDRERALCILAAHRSEFRAMGVRELSIFGSMARGEATEASDVDVLVDYEPGTPLSFFRVCELRYRIEDLLGAPVDLVTTGGLRPEIRDEVLREAIRAA